MFLFLTLIQSEYTLNPNEDPLNTGKKNEYKSDLNLKSSVPITKTFGDSSESPTSVNIDGYYATTQENKDLYIKVDLEAGEIYYIYTEYRVNYLYLFSDSAFSDEIESITGANPICFAPNTDSAYYIKWGVGAYVSGFGHLIGVFKAVKYSASDVQNGVSITFNDDDWARSVIYFKSPNSSTCNEDHDIEITAPSSVHSFFQIDENSGDAFNVNEMGQDLREHIFNNDQKSYLLIFYTQGTFKITVPEPSFSFTPIEIDWGLILNIVIIIGSIIGIVGIIYSNHRYWKIGKKIKQSRERKKERERGEKKRKEREKQRKKEEKELENIKKKELDREKIEKIQQIVRVSESVKLDMMKNTLGLSEYVFNNLVFDWAEKFGFKIKGDEIIIDHEKIDEFIEYLEEQFEAWERGDKIRYCPICHAKIKDPNLILCQSCGAKLE